MATAAVLDDVISGIGTGPRGRSTGAFLDVDGAVIAGAIEPASPADVQGKGEADLVTAGEKAFARKVADKVFAETRELVAAHKRKGHTVVLTSAAYRHQVRPLADALGVDEIVCSELSGPTLAGDARAAAVSAFASEHKIDLARSHAYASADDAIALLLRVGNPHPTNPSSKLASFAAKEKWPALRFESRGRPGAATFARSMAAYGMMLPSMAGGVAVRILNGDPHAVTEFGVHNWVERLFAFTGVSLNVQGEENLWSHRPAVFIYNHRNNFDPYIAIKLVRKDWGSVAKKEIAGPLTGVMKWLTPNVAFIDRSDAEKAVEGLRPVTELLQSGVSVLVAPEGTRSKTGQLGRFKKGAFRMAMEAGVPLVPIVIRNADRVTNREATVIRGGRVDVRVLPPVSVEGWTLEGLDARIDEVRQLFADTLADWPS
jgi:putative phosphoserine phosphatase/1-acylglycerol-3-phosphate O-acyltransferase